VLKRFFQDYKQLEGKQVQVEDIRPSDAAVMVIERALARYHANGYSEKQIETRGHSNLGRVMSGQLVDDSSAP